MSDSPTGSILQLEASSLAPSPTSPESEETGGMARKGSARLAASMLFLTDGITFGTWATLIPSFKEKFSLTEAALSVALLGMVVGALISMPLTGRMIARFGSRACLRVAAPGFAVALCLLAMAPGFAIFVAMATVFGAFKGAFDVSVNTQGIAVENAVKKPIIASFQALWSIGGLLAAMVIGAALKQGVGPLPIALTMGGLVAAMGIFYAARTMGGDAVPKAKEGKSSGFQWPAPKLLRIGLLAAMALFAEGVMMDWSAVYSSSIGGAAAWLAPMAYGVFSLCMATGRAAGDYLMGRFGAAHLLRASGILTTIGLVIIVAIQQWPATFAGLAFAGFGLSNLVPILFGAGGRAHPGGVGKGVAMISMMGYFGFLAGPPMIGGIGHLIGLPGAFSVLILFSGFIALCGNKVLRAS